MHYFATTRRISLVHGDDFITLADDEGQDYFKARLKKWYQYKMRRRLGPKSTDSRECRVLNRYILWPEGQEPEYEADPRHGEAIVKELGLENAKPVITPVEKNPPRGEDDEVKLGPSAHKRYRSIVAKANYLGADRMDVQHTV